MKTVGQALPMITATNLLLAGFLPLAGSTVPVCGSRLLPASVAVCFLDAAEHRSSQHFVTHGTIQIL